MGERYEHLGEYSGWVDEAERRGPLYLPALPGAQTRRKVQDLLGFYGGPEEPADVRVERRWEHEGVSGEEVSWPLGYGPRTRAWVLKPSGVHGTLHGHDGFKFFGKEKIADGPGGPEPAVVRMRETMYGGRAFPNVLAREGFVVLAHDVFLWGSRRFQLEDMPERTREVAAATQGSQEGLEGAPPEVALYNAAAFHHEPVIEKYCALLGTTLAGVVSHEDRVAAAYLSSRGDVATGPIGCVGLSGGGCRAALLQATCESIGAAVVVGMMSSYRHLLDHNVDSHTWMFFPHGLARFGDWPDLAACRAPSPLMVQYDREDQLFTETGMRAAHDRIAYRYREAGDPDGYVGEFYEGPHKFDIEMQESAFAWMRSRLAE